MNASTAMLHFASDANDRTFAVGNCRSIEQLHQLWHQPLSEHRPRLKRRSQILDELPGERVVNNRHPDSARDWPICLDAEFREHSFASGDEFADLDHDLLP